MHPLSIFPDLFTYALIAPTLLRLMLGVIAFFAGYSRSKSDYRGLSVLYFVTSILIILGFYTQLAVILGMILSSIDYVLSKKNGVVSSEKIILYSLVKIALLSLLFSGPGFFALDIPL